MMRIEPAVISLEIEGQTVVLHLGLGGLRATRSQRYTQPATKNRR